jgi:hypothetical protein
MSASVCGVRGSSASVQSTLLANSRHSEPPWSLIVSGVTLASAVLPFGLVNR